jgi:hypothetical protein
MTGLFAAVLLVALAGCGSEPLSPAIENAQADQFMERASEIKDRVVLAGRMTPELRSELNVLVQDVEGWQARTGRTDIVITRSDPAHDGSRANAAVMVAPGGGGTTCSPCPLVKMFGDQVCFLVEVSPCRDDIISQVCAYMCLKRTRSLTATPAPTRTRGKS